MIERTDYDLLNGNSDDFAELYARYSSGIESFLYKYKLVRNLSDKDDILQLVWIRVHAKKKLYDPKWAFSTWISQVALRVTLNFYRNLGIIPFLTNQNFEDTIDYRESRDTLVVGEITQRVREVVGRLPDNAKEAIEKVYFSNLRFGTKTYHQGYKRGRRLLRSSLKVFYSEIRTA